jgi:hypothetical protein
MEMEISSLFHKYINFMLTTDDRYLVEMPNGIRSYEVTGWWASQPLRETERNFKDAGYEHPTLDAIMDHFKSGSYSRKMPLIMYCWDGSYELQYFPPDKSQPALVCAIASKDVYEMRREAKSLGIWVEAPAELSSPVVITLQTPIV